MHTKKSDTGIRHHVGTSPHSDVPTEPQNEQVWASEAALPIFYAIKQYQELLGSKYNKMTTKAKLANSF